MPQKRANPKKASDFVIRTLRDAGHDALLAGGCVRDMLLGLQPKDYDVATDALPERVGKLFPRARMVGAQFGVVLVRKFGTDIEVATFRSDGDYSDGRRPENVAFTSAQEDARRRDFTINGMFYDPMEQRLIDYVGGENDLRAGIVRTIGDPAQRFAEDHLRMLRAIRFAARFGFVLDENTKTAIQGFAGKLRQISAERIWMELEKILTAPSRRTGWTLLRETALRPQLAAAWKADPDADDGAAARLALLPEEPIKPGLALAVVWHAESVADARRLARQLKISNAVTNAAVWLLKHLPEATSPESLELADLKTLMAHSEWAHLRLLARIDEAVRTGQATKWHDLAARADAIHPALINPLPFVTGDDLQTELNLPAGPKMGRILRAVHRAQLNEDIHNREQALNMAATLTRDDAA